MEVKSEYVESFIDALKVVAHKHGYTIKFEDRSCKDDYLKVTIDDGWCAFSYCIEWHKFPNFMSVSADIWEGFHRSRRAVTKTRTANTSPIQNVIFNPPATIVFWADGTKTVVKAQNEDEFDAEKGLAMAISKKALGNQGNYFNTFTKWTDSWKKEEDEIDKKVNAIIKDIRKSDDNVFDQAIRTVIETIKKDILGVE